ncbi:MAG: PAS domain S-box protein [Balneolaceae bacterium]|nr:PAS domain S-box protein [Balneolaceae bacterium]
MKLEKKPSELIFNHSRDLFCIAGFDGFFKTLNPSWSRTLGWTLEELLSRPWNEFVHPDDIDRTENVKSEIVDGKEVYSFDNRYRCKDGSYKWLEWSSYPYPEDGIMFAVARDVTKRRDDEEKIRQSEQQFKSLFEDAPVSMMVLDKDTGEIVEANEKACELYGINSPVELKKIHIFTDEPPYSEKDALRWLQKAVEEGKQEIEWKSTIGSGIEKWQIVTLKPINFKGLERVLAVAVDITARKNAEKQFHILVNNSYDLIWMLRADGVFTYASPSWKSIFGYEPDEVINKPMEAFIHPDDLSICTDYIEEVLEAKKITIGPQYRVKHGQGSWRWHEVTMTPVYNSRGEFEYFVGVSRDITEKKDAENTLLDNQSKLKHSHQMMQYVVENSNGAIAILDSDLHFKYVSERFLSEYDVKAKEIIGRHHYDVFPDLPQKWRDVHQRVLKGEILKKDEDRYVKADGNVDWTRWECRPWYNERNEIAGIILYTEVITKFKKSELELKKLSLAVEQSPASILITNTEGVIEYVNPKFTELTGYTRDEAIGNNPSMLKSGTQSAEFYKVMWETITAGKVWRGELHNRKKNGEYYWEDATISPVFNSAGEIINFLAVKEDVTEKKKAETKLMESELYHRSLVQTIPDMIFVVSKDGTFLDYKSSFGHELYNKPAEFLNKKLTDMLPPDVAEKQMDAIQKSLATKSTIEFDYSLTVEGSDHFYNAKTTGFGEDRVITTVRDITDYQKNLEKIKTLLKVEEQLSENLQNFTHIVSHNLRIHTANMMGILMMLEETDPELYKNQFIQMLAGSSENLEETIRDLNEILNIKQGTRKDFEDLVVQQSINKIEEYIVPDPKKEGVEIINEVPAGLTVYAVPGYLNSVLMNLISNGVKYRSNERKSWIRISVAKCGDYVAIKVKDNGVGIDLARHRDKLFEMYRKFHDSDSKGFGLFITKVQVEAMGGYIEADSEPGKGSTFTVYIPNGKNERSMVGRG